MPAVMYMCLRYPWHAFRLHVVAWRNIADGLDWPLYVCIVNKETKTQKPMGIKSTASPVHWSQSWRYYQTTWEEKFVQQMGEWNLMEGVMDGDC